MLKRTQIMLNDWLIDYIKTIVEEYDLSFSEVVRIALCLEFIKLIAKFYPEYKPKISDESLMEIIAEFEQGTHSREKFHRLISDIYFEARKATELRLNHFDKTGRLKKNPRKKPRKQPSAV